jgi:hypothetical protein
MKKSRMIGVYVLAVMIAMLGVKAIADVSFMTSGWGSAPNVTATTNAVQTTGFNLRALSIFNTSTSNPTIFALVNISATGMMARVNTSSNAIAIPGGYSYTFNADNTAVIQSFCIMTTNSTAPYIAAGY